MSKCLMNEGPPERWTRDQAGLYLEDKWDLEPQGGGRGSLWVSSRW